jgi:hypothetical protein
VSNTYASLPALTSYDPESVKAWIIAATQILTTLVGAKPDVQAGRACTVFTTNQPADNNQNPTTPPSGAKPGDLWLSMPSTQTQGIAVSIWVMINSVGQWVPITSNWAASGGTITGAQAFQ